MITTTTRYLLTLVTAFALTAFAEAQNDQPMKYRVTAYRNGDTTVVSQSNIARVMAPANLYVPNAFTPNGDGINDLFGAKGDGIIEYSIQIFNRWGELVFESSDINKQWDGTYKGQIAETGAYAYSITAYGEKTNRISKSGTVTLIQ
ncbi:MAG: gliding motility-associated C-terminal domain-containing protein [Bacteroidota bacterium]